MDKKLVLMTKSIPKRLRGVFVFWVCLGVLSCGLAQAKQPKFIGMGDSIGEGVQSADASEKTQRFSYLKFLAKQMGVRFRLPLISSSRFGVVGEMTFRSRLFPDFPALNLSVSGADVESLLKDWADALDEDDIDSETDLVLFPRIGSQMKIVERIARKRGPPFVACWIGNNDVLSAAISYDELDASQMTPIPEFKLYFDKIVQRLAATGARVVFANIPDVTRIGFLLDRRDLVRFLGSDYGLAEGDFTSIAVMLLIRLGLDDGGLLDDPDFVLDAREVGLIQESIEAFNDIIETAAAGIGAPVVDINAMFDDAEENPPRFFGIPVTPRFLGGIFSLDGVHPSNIGHALAANAFIETINSHFGMDIPLISDKKLRRIFLRDPFQDKDGDGRVKGRAGAGLLETLGPELGISGDKNDFLPNVPPGISSRAGERFVERYLKLRGKDPQMASEWTQWDAIEAFRYIFRLSVFTRSGKAGNTP
jgi:hypothetical protein